LNGPKISRSIYRYSLGKGIETIQDVIINEEVYKLYVNNSFYRNLYCTPNNLEELVTGYLATERLIAESKNINEIKLVDGAVKVKLTPCPPRNIEMVNSDIFCPAERLIELMEEHLNKSILHKQTGGVHIMSLAVPEGLLISREDIGRHNAVDKIYGYCLINNVRCSDKIFLSSGRISHEIMQKLIMMGIKMVVSRAAVTSLAQEEAEQAEITTIGFARGQRFNVYTHPYRIIAGKGR
jgi:FdhD protein